MTRPELAGAPHIHGPLTTQYLMCSTILALIPALAVGIMLLGLRALLVTGVCISAAIASEWLWDLANHRQTVQDGSAVLTGLLLAMTLPASVSFPLAAAGAVFAVVVMKALGGALGRNVCNPALAARAMMLLVAPREMTCYFVPGSDTVTAATPLHQMVRPALPDVSLWDAFWGNIPGSIGEVSALALLLGGAFLVWRRVITLHIPLSYLGTAAVLTLLFYRTEEPLLWMLYQLLCGGLMLGAIFMATDYATCPVTPWGKVLYGMGCGALTVLLRYESLYPEGVSYAILLMNGFSWLLTRHTIPHRFGTAGEVSL